MKNVQDSISRMIAKRDKIWQQYDYAMSNQKDLTQRFSSYSKKSGQVTTISPLTPNQLPPDEVQACLDKLSQTEGKIKKEKATIETYERQIESLKNQANILIIGLCVGGFVLLVILVSLMSNKSSNNSNSSQLYQLNTQKVVIKLSK